MPPEFILNRELDAGAMAITRDIDVNNVAFCILGCCMCAYCGFLFLPPYCSMKKRYVFTASRIGLSSIEWIIIVIFGILEYMNDSDEQPYYLFNIDHCLSFFIVCTIFLIIYTKFEILMPDIALPLDVPIRSKWGYAFLGDVIELQRLKMSEKFESTAIGYSNGTIEHKLPPKFHYTFWQDEKFKEQRFWNESYGATENEYSFAYDLFLQYLGIIQYNLSNANVSHIGKLKQVVELSQNEHVHVSTSTLTFDKIFQTWIGTLTNGDWRRLKYDNFDDVVLGDSWTLEYADYTRIGLKTDHRDYYRKKNKDYNNNDDNKDDDGDDTVTEEDKEILTERLLTKFKDLNKNYYRFNAVTSKTPYLFALANKQYETVEWLVSQGGAWTLDVDDCNKMLKDFAIDRRRAKILKQMPEYKSSRYNTNLTHNERHEIQMKLGKQAHKMAQKEINETSWKDLKDYEIAQELLSLSAWYDTNERNEWKSRFF